LGIALDSSKKETDYSHLYTFKKGYYKVNARKPKKKLSVGSSCVTLPLEKEASV
jgi:hypothetical protein